MRRSRCPRTCSQTVATSQRLFHCGAIITIRASRVRTAICRSYERTGCVSGMFVPTSRNILASISSALLFVTAQSPSVLSIARSPAACSSRPATSTCGESIMSRVNWPSTKASSFVSEGAARAANVPPRCAASRFATTERASSHDAARKPSPSLMSGVSRRVGLCTTSYPQRPLTQVYERLTPYSRAEPCARFTSPSRVCTSSEQPTGQKPQTERTVCISHGCSPYSRSVSAPTGQTWMHMPQCVQSVS